MNLSNIILFLLAVLIIIALFILHKTRTRLKEMDGFRSIKEPKDDFDDGIIDSFGD